MRLHELEPTEIERFGKLVKFNLHKHQIIPSYIADICQGHYIGTSSFV